MANEFIERLERNRNEKIKFEQVNQRLIEEYDLMLSGTQYLDKDNNSRYYNAEGSRAGTLFELRHEDDNLYDPLAIIVLHKGKEIGYIPKDENLEIAYYLHHPEQFAVECKQKKKQIRRDYEMIVVIVKVFAIVENYRPFSFEVFDEVFADYDENVNKLAQKRKEIEQEKERERIEKQQQEAEIKKLEDKKALKGCLVIIGIVIVAFLIYKAFDYYASYQKEKTKYYINKYCYYFDLGLEDNLLTKHTDTIFEKDIKKALEKGYYEYFYSVHRSKCDSNRVEMLNYKKENIEMYFSDSEKDSLKALQEQKAIEIIRETDSILSRLNKK